jgi:hypothetical protein
MNTVDVAIGEKMIALLLELQEAVLEGALHTQIEVAPDTMRVDFRA